MAHVWPDMPLIPTASNPEGVEWHDRPFELGVYWGMGYHMLGEEYAYEAEYTKLGFDLQYFVTDTFAIGLDFPFYYPTFDAVQILIGKTTGSLVLMVAHLNSSLQTLTVLTTKTRLQTELVRALRLKVLSAVSTSPSPC